MDLFGGVETELEEGRRAATWRGVHVSLYSELVALPGELLQLAVFALAGVSPGRCPEAQFPALMSIVLFTVNSAVKLFHGNVAGSEVDRRRIRSDCLVFRVKLWES